MKKFSQLADENGHVLLPGCIATLLTTESLETLSDIIAR